MKAEERRSQILHTLRNSDGPCSASALAAALGVSRQIIVGDIALLRAAGLDIHATARGYVLPGDLPGLIRRVVCLHTAEQMREELYCMFDQGCLVRDVIVEHPIYNELTGRLELASRYDVDRFLEMCAEADAMPLSALTEGIHVHTLVCPDEAAYERVREALGRRGFLFGENDF